MEDKECTNYRALLGRELSHFDMMVRLECLNNFQKAFIEAYLNAEREGVYDPIVGKPVKDIIYNVFCEERKRIYREHGIERRF